MMARWAIVLVLAASLFSACGVPHRHEEESSDRSFDPPPLPAEAQRANLADEPSHEGRTVSEWIAYVAQERAKAREQRSRDEAGFFCAPGEWSAPPILKDAMSNFGPDALPFVVQAIATDDSDARYLAGTALKELVRTDEDVALLAKHIDDEDPRIRRHLLFVLHERPGYPPEETIAPLARRFDSDYRDRLYVTSILGRPGFSAAVPVFRERLASPDDRARAAAIRALGQIGEPARVAIPEIRAGLEDDSFYVRAASRRTLGSFGESHPDEVLFDQKVRDAAEIQKPERTTFSRYMLPEDLENLVFVIDKSGSMARHLDSVVELVARLVKSLPDGTRFGIVFFDGAVHPFPGSGALTSATVESRADAVDFARSQAKTNGSGSCLEDGLKAGLSMALGAEADNSALVYIGDANPTCRGESARLHMHAAFDSLTRMNDGRVEVHALCLKPRDVDPLCFLAGVNGGKCALLDP